MPKMLKSFAVMRVHAEDFVVQRRRRARRNRSADWSRVAATALLSGRPEIIRACPGCGRTTMVQNCGAGLAAEQRHIEAGAIGLVD